MEVVVQFMSSDFVEEWVGMYEVVVGIDFGLFSIVPSVFWRCLLACSMISWEGGG